MTQPNGGDSLPVTGRGMATAARSEQPVAIVGMACRFPGAADIPAFWRSLEEGLNSVVEGVPGSGRGRVGELFPDSMVQSEACRFGAYLDDLTRFDAAFFRISPVEAQLLDPQQRLMLETSWRALEDAGMDPDRLRGSRTGVYAGISNYDYRGLILDATDTAEPAPSLYSVTGTSFNTAIGRVAYVLGLHGPAIAVDTACSSSLVAVHQAVTALQRDEADMALAGGVHTILSGRLLELRANAGMLAPDGRCKTFDAAADGYVRGEGCGMLVIKRLEDAEADGDRIWAVIRGTALNQDGASQGLTVPNGAAQELVIAAALRRAGIRPSEVDYVEAHGTGTPVGDPIEAQATGNAYAKGREADRPLLIGSVKTNIGHLESAAGVAGIVKTVLAINHRKIPKHLNYRTPNPEIDWERLPLHVTSEATPWPVVPDRPPLAGVSGFGWSGTNAHVLLEGHGTPGRVPAGPADGRWPRGTPRSVRISLPEWITERVPRERFTPRTTRLLPLSGRTPEALRDLADRYLAWLDENSADPAAPGLLADMAWTASVGRSHFSRRAGVTFVDADSLRRKLGALVANAEDVPSRPGGRVAFAYTGQASQWAGMGEALYESEPVVRAVLDRCDAVLREQRDVSLLDVMFGRAGHGDLLDEAAWTQPAIYALECALTALWASVGIEPEVVVGHSLGEIAAAQAAGVYTLEDGLLFAAARGELMGALPGKGAMAAVFAPADRVRAAVARQNAASGSNPGVSIAADNGAQQVVSGPEKDVEAIVGRFESEGVWARKLRKSPAYHSALVEPALDDLERVLASVKTAAASCSLVSSMTGRVMEADGKLDGGYWRQQARRPVAFRDCIGTLADLEVDVVIEIGPRAVLGPMVLMGWPDASGRTPTVLSSLIGPPDPSDHDEGTGFEEAVAGAYQAGLAVTFEGLYAGEERRRVPVPGYPFQRERYWVEAPRRRRRDGGHPLLGVHHESPRGEVLFETELSPSDPAWLGDHRVFDRVVAPGSLYAAMAMAAAGREGNGSASVEDCQLQNALVLPETDPETGDGERSRRVQLVIEGSDPAASRRVEVFSKAEDEDGWTLHMEATLSPATRRTATRTDLTTLTAGLSPRDPSEFYRDRSETNVTLDPLFRTLRTLWSGDGRAVGEIALPEMLDLGGLEAHPVLLDGCFQVAAEARGAGLGQEGTTYLPFGWDRLWLSEPLPARVFCHTRLREGTLPRTPGEAPEVLAAELTIYTPDGVEIGGVSGYTVKRATRDALVPAAEGVEDLLYDVVWRDRPLAPATIPADFLPSPSAVRARSGDFSEYLAAEGVSAADRTALLTDLERLSWSYALSTLEGMGWEREKGAVTEPDALGRSLGILDEHGRLFRRLFELLERAGAVERVGTGFAAKVGKDDPLPEHLARDPEDFADRMHTGYPHGTNEIGLFRRSAAALADVLVGQADPLTLLFGSGEPTAGDVYRKAPGARASNKMLGDAIAALVEDLPEGRRLRILEVGAGTGSATASVLPELPAGRFDYVYTDISAGFFAEAEGRFAEYEEALEYRPLDIELDPVSQGYEPHAYDIVIAANVLHATRYLEETLANCRELLAPSGQLVALETLGGHGWLDLTFGPLDGWWRFADSFRPHHALVGPAVWERALANTDFGEIEILGPVDSNDDRDRGVIMARGPVEVTERPGVWVLASDAAGAAEALAGELAARNQAVFIVDEDAADCPSDPGVGVDRLSIERHRRDLWRSIFEGLPSELPLNGVVHMVASDGGGPGATSGEFARDVRDGAETALALVQGMADADAAPAKGLWFLTRGGQVLEKESEGQLSGAVLWGFGKVVAREAAHFRPRMIDLDPAAAPPLSDLVGELLHPDTETHIAYRLGLRQVARLVRAGEVTERLTLPDGDGWRLEPDAGGSLDGLAVMPWPDQPLEPRDVRVALEATGLNFWDLFRSLGVIEEGLLGREFCGRVLEVGSEVSTVSAGDRVVGLAFGTFGPRPVMREELVALAPASTPAADLATMPTAYVTVLLSFDLARLAAGERVLIHAGAGGVGTAAIRMAHALGAEVFATASTPKHAYVRSLGVEHVFDSRRTEFGRQILEATGGRGVDVVLNSLTSEGFIEASLSCLAPGGRFVELAAVDILTEEEMKTARPDVAYWIVDLDWLKEHEPPVPGDALRRVMEHLAAGEVAPLAKTRWALNEAVSAIKYMGAARHRGKIVLAASPIESGRLRDDRTYLVTGGLGGIGCALAGWLADLGAGAIVLNGRRDPDPEAAALIEEVRSRGATVQVELADVTDGPAIDAMLSRIDATLPPLGGVIHSVGVLSDGALTNQTWEKFEEVLWPKVMGAWHLHRATRDRDLDMFILFSSVAGVMGNPGQANHSAANAFLDQLAGHRRALGLAGQSIAWGAWSGIGEAEEHRERIERALEAKGTGWITPAQGLEALEQLVRQDVTSAMAAAVDWEAISSGDDQPPPLLEDLLSEAAAGDRDQAGETVEDLLTRLRAASGEEREEILAAFVQGELQAVMRLPNEPPRTVDFSDLGMDSLMAVELRNRLNRAFAGEYTAPNTVVFDYPNAVDLARHLASELGEPDTVIAPPPPVLRRPPSEDAIAVVGIGLRLPGADDVSEFWRRLEAGENAVTDGRQDGGRWNGVAGDPAADDPATRHGAFIERIDRFDSRFFRISPIEAKGMDPKQRMLLETAWHALEDAGIDPDRLRGSRTGVYMGVGGSEYRRLVTAKGMDDSYAGTSGSIAVGRIAFALGLEGPAVPLDLACTSSLVAVHQALAGLQRGEADLALAGGVNAVLSPAVMRFLLDTGLLSNSGQCWAFDASADGYVRGEGCGVVVLKRLEDAEADGDRIWGVIRGSAVNQNGAGLGLTLPNGPAQERAMEDALAQSGVESAAVDYMEAHGPGTQIGDAVEINATANVYGRGRAEDRPLLIGSVKTNIGHLEAAGGVAGLIKVLLAMQRQSIPTHLNFRDPNPDIDWERLPVLVTSERTAWPETAGRPPLAAVNAFGFSGSNAHLVVEGYGGGDDGSSGVGGAGWPAGSPTPVATSVPEGAADSPPSEGSGARRARLLPLSGKTDRALRELARRYLGWLDDHADRLAGPDQGDSMLADMAWTASVGRSHMERRAAVVFCDAGSLRDQLTSVAGRDEQEQGGSPPAERSPDGGSEPDDYRLLVEDVAVRYEAGQAVPFERLFTGEARRRISLPGYPFQRRSHWFE